MESGRLNTRTERELVWHCWGSFADALWHRFNRSEVMWLLNEVPRRPGICLVGLIALLIGSLVVCHPGRFYGAMFAQPLYSVPSRVLTVTLDQSFAWVEPSRLQAAAESWREGSPEIEAMATYEWRPSLVLGPRGKETILSARITPNLFELLGARIAPDRGIESSDLARCADCAVVSELLWRSQFGDEQKIVNRSLILNGQTMKVVGVLPSEFRFPGRDIDAFTLLGADSHGGAPRFAWPGLLIRLSPQAEVAKAKGEAERSMRKSQEVPADSEIRISTVTDLQREMIRSWVQTAMLSLLLLVLFCWSDLARFVITGPRGMDDVARWYLFFGVKVILLAGAVGSVSNWLGYMVLRNYNATNAYVLAMAANIWFVLLSVHLAFKWASRDQLARCRVCLKRFGTRVTLGAGPHSLLDATGEEMVCDAGHGALHIPAMETSSSDVERWTYLDDSWQVLVGKTH